MTDATRADQALRERLLLRWWSALPTAQELARDAAKMTHAEDCSVSVDGTKGIVTVQLDTDVPQWCIDEVQQELQGWLPMTVLLVLRRSDQHYDWNGREIGAQWDEWIEQVSGQLTGATSD